MSDLHASKVVPASLIEHAVAEALAAKPDIVCLTGDFVTNQSGYDPQWYASTLGRLAAQVPSFASLGNHDGGIWSASNGGYPATAAITSLLAGCGMHVLENQSTVIEAGGQELQIVGAGDLWAGALEPEKAFREANASLPTLLLSHNPDTKALLHAQQWDLMLSGHTHGGQVVLPGFGYNPAPVWDRAYVAGLKFWRGRRIHISRGVGNVAGVRFNCRPEITKLRLMPA